jgi:uncharacterized protein (TIGR00255 family)
VADFFHLAPLEAAKKLAEDFQIPVFTDNAKKRNASKKKEKPKRTLYQTEKKFEEWERESIRILSDYLHLLEEWKIRYAPKTPEEEWKAASQAVAEAVGHLVEFRTQEGLALQKKFSEKIDNIERLLGEIEPFEKSRVEKIRQRLTERLEELKGVDYDKNRLEQELIYYIEKLDISEEKQRLANHLKYFRETMETSHGQGKKLGFIAQEMGREINTTGSKSNQAEMQNIVVKMKDELEQIKEQVLNAL